MMTDGEFEIWCQRNSIPDSGKAYISRIRSGPPSRLVGGQGGNACGIYPSDKSGFTQQFESRNVELPAIYIRYEYADSILEFYTQAEPIEVEYRMTNGKKKSYTHTPDTLAIAENGAFLDQWKPHEQLVKLAQAHPDRYGQDEDGVWHYYPGEKAVREMGLQFRLRSSAELNPTLFRNLQFLEDYVRKPLIIPPEMESQS